MNFSDKPLITCITPTLNSEDYLEIFLEELRLQTIFPNFEVVLNLSSPSHYEMDLVEKYKTVYGDSLVVVIHEEVIPLGVAWNECISLAKSDLIAIWNVDDLRTSNSLEAQIESFSEDDVVVSYGPYTIVNSFTSRTGREILELNLSNMDFLRGMHFGPFMAFRKDILDLSGVFDEQLYSGGDFDLAIRLALQGKAARTNEYLGFYLDAGRGASTSPNSKQLVERTVIELRYGIYDKIDFSFLNSALDYDVKNFHVGHRKIPVESIQGVESLLASARLSSSNKKTLRMTTLKNRLWNFLR